MIDDAISDTMSTVAVTSRSAYSFLSAGTRSRALPDDRDADLAELRDQLLVRQLHPVPRDRLQLVEGAAGVPEPATAHLPERDAAGGDDRADGDRRLVPDAAGRVLVDHLPAERRAELERLAARGSSRR